MTAQDTLLLLNGKSLPGLISDESGVDILFDIVKKNGKPKTLRYNRGEIFSMKKGEEEARVLYEQDPLLGYDLSQEDMRSYMYGQDDARNGYRALPTTIGGFAVGLGSTLALEGGAIPFLSPLVYSLGMQIPFIKVRKESISDQRYTLSPLYLDGYDKTARSKKFVHGFLGSMAGVFIGSGILLVAD